MKTVFTAAELMEEAMSCLQNMPEPEKKEFYCHTEGKLVSKDQAEIVCWTSGHNVETGSNTLFSREPK